MIAIEKKELKRMVNCEKVEDCPCPKTACPNHGICYACVAKHRKSDTLPCCLFPDNGGDKSLRNFYNKLKDRFEKQ